jgi:hypothetical protein
VRRLLVQNGFSLASWLCTKIRYEGPFLVQAGLLNQNSLRIHRHRLECGSGAAAFPSGCPTICGPGLVAPRPASFPRECIVSVSTL